MLENKRGRLRRKDKLPPQFSAGSSQHPLCTHRTFLQTPLHDQSQIAIISGYYIGSPSPSRIGIPQLLLLQNLYPTLLDHPPSPTWYLSPLLFSPGSSPLNFFLPPGANPPTTQSQRALRQTRSCKTRETRERSEAQAEMGSAYIKSLDR